MSGHQSVLLEESIALLNPKPGGFYVDLTFGRGGTSRAILEKIGPRGRLLAFDKDLEALSSPEAIALKKQYANLQLVHSDYRSASEYLSANNYPLADGITADLGVSSPQFDEGERGFSYRMDGPLDMRMDQSASLTAAMVLNTYSPQKLLQIFEKYGEEEEAKRAVKGIVHRREEIPFTRTLELVEVLKNSFSNKRLSKKGHPAKKIFQALRIEVNQELSSLEKMLEEIPFHLKENGRLVIISFHSLEDRLVKNNFRELSVEEIDRHSPVNPQKKDFRIVTRKPLVAEEKEIDSNIRAHSAKLRALERK